MTKCLIEIQRQVPILVSDSLLIGQSRIEKTDESRILLHESNRRNIKYLVRTCAICRVHCQYKHPN